MIYLLMQGRVQTLEKSQPERDTWRTAVLGADALELWEFKSDKNGYCERCMRAARVGLKMDMDSPGFRLLVRWLATDLRVGACVCLFTEPSYPPACKRLMGPCHAAGLACDV